MSVRSPRALRVAIAAFALVWDGHTLHGLNASGTAPAAWDTAYFKRKHGGNYPQRGWDTVTVPGAISAWAALHEKFGKLPFADLLAPAIELAERGHGVASIVQQKWAAQVPELSSQPGFAQTFMPRGRAPEVGERFVFADAGRTLRRIAETRGRDFYEGQTAEALVAHARDNGGSMSMADLAGYRPDWCGTIQKDYRGYTLHEIPPNGQGIAALMALGILSNFDMAQYPPDSVETRHLQIEAMKAAFADVYRYVADIRHMKEVTPAHLLDDAYLAQRARRISMDKATDFAHGMPPSGGTIYLTAADASGMMISFIQSNYQGFGSGVVVPGVGVSLQNRGYCFSLDESHPNCVAPGKRPFQTIIPAFLMKDGAPQMSFGVMGGNMQPQGHMQTLTRMLDHRQNPQAACDAPRWKVQRGLNVDIEPTMEPSVIEALRQRGHHLGMTTDAYMDFGSGQFIWRLTDDMEDGYAAASDSRRDGHAAAF